MPSSCCVKGCFNKQAYCGYSMFGFPSNPDMRNLWLEAIGLYCGEPKSHHRICEVHFNPELIYFVGSRKELEKNAVPTLFCNCSYTKLASLAQAKQATKAASHNFSAKCGATTLDHSYSYSPVLKEHVKKENDCDGKQNIEVNFQRKGSLKHSPDCNLMRAPLKTAPKGPVNDNKGILRKTLINKPLETEVPLFYGSSRNIMKKAKTDCGKLRLQLKTALNENAKLKEELSMLKGILLPITTLPSNSVKLTSPTKLKVVQLKKVA